MSNLLFILIWKYFANLNLRVRIYLRLIQDNFQNATCSGDCEWNGDKNATSPVPAESFRFLWPGCLLARGFRFSGPAIWIFLPVGDFILTNLVLSFQPFKHCHNSVFLFLLVFLHIRWALVDHMNRIMQEKKTVHLHFVFQFFSLKFPVGLLPLQFLSHLNLDRRRLST